MCKQATQSTPMQGTGMDTRGSAKGALSPPSSPQPNVRFMLNVNEMEKASKTKELGVLDRSNLSQEDLEEFEQRAKGWEYMVNFEHMDDAIGRYSHNKDNRIEMSGGGVTGTYTFSSKEAADNLIAILNTAKAKQPPFSHVDMMGCAGGKFYIAKDAEEAVKLERSPWQTEENFLKMYAMASLYGHKTWLVEQRQEIFRYFLDLDFNQPGILLPEKIEAVVFVVLKSLNKFYADSPENLLRCICSSTVCKIERCKACVCECKGVEKDCEECKGVGNTGKRIPAPGTSLGTAPPCIACGGEFPVRKKTGIHLLFPGVFVTAKQALDMRETVIAECTRVWGFRSSPFNSWPDVVDGSVYNKAGLRMICARKGEPCKECKSRKADEKCPACKNSRRIDQGRPYFPLACFSGRGLRDQAMEKTYENDFVKLVQDTSIRYFGDTPTAGYALYEGAPKSSTALKIKPMPAAGLTRVGGQKRVLSETTGTLLSQQLALDAPEVRAIQSFFSEESVKNKHCSAHYGELVVSQVKYKKKDECFKVDVSGKNSRYCLNKGDNHGGNRVYFLFRAATTDHPMGVVQKCYCEKEEARKYGPCVSYTSSPMTIPHKIASILFPSSGGGGSGASMAEESSVLTRMDFRGMSIKARSQNQLLLTAGNIMCKELFNTVWTNSPRFCSMFGSSMLETSALPKALTVYRPFKMDSIGPDDSKALKWINIQGFIGTSTSTSKETRSRKNSVMDEEDIEDKGKTAKPKTSKKGMDSIEKRLNLIITNILGVALHHEERKIIQTLEKETLVDLARGVPDQPDFNILECLDLFIVEAQRIKVLHANLSGSQEAAAFDVKQRKKESKSIMMKLQKSLLKLLNYRHDEPMENSHRHSGYGWSTEIVDKKFRENVRKLMISLHEKL